MGGGLQCLGEGQSRPACSTSTTSLLAGCVLCLSPPPGGPGAGELPRGAGQSLRAQPRPHHASPKNPCTHLAQSSGIGGFNSFDSPAKQGTGQRTLKTPPQGIEEEVASAHLSVCTITGEKEQTQTWHQLGMARKAAPPWVMELPRVCCPCHTTGKGRSCAEEVWP